MSAICAIINFDGQPVDPAQLERMAGALARRGPDGVRFSISGNVGFAHLARHTTPESSRERQPIVVRNGELIFAADARIDNREELIATLDERDPTDAHLILAAYNRWGDKCPQHLIGDFAFALWDKRQQRLFATRDAVGVRQLFYSRHKDRVLIASTVGAIIAGLGSAPALNDLLVVDLLCNHFDRWVHETVYQNVFRVPASHWLELRREGEKIERYWTFGATQLPRYTKDEDYLEQYRELFQEAVRCRLRSASPVGIAVSGGLDSSSIACVANDLAGRRAAEVQSNIRLYSIVSSKYPTRDERSYWQAVQTKCSGLASVSIDGDAMWCFRDVGSLGGLRTDEPDLSWTPRMWVEMLTLARRDGCRVLLMGEGGDQMLTSDAYHRPELILDVGVKRLRSELKHFWRYSGWQMGVPVARSLARSKVASTPLRRYLRRRSTLSLRKAPSWVKREWVMRSNSVSPRFRSDEDGWLGDRTAALAYRRVTSGWDGGAVLSHLASIGGLMDVEISLPYYDRRLIDFLLRIPSRLRFGHGRDKLILRKAMTGILPDEVRLRADYCFVNGDDDLRTRERDKCSVLVEKVAETLESYLHTEKLREAWNSFQQGSIPATWTLCEPLLLEAWLRPLPENGLDTTRLDT
jgi:asparagine synthase (glutamine-hydrolysing)